VQRLILVVSGIVITGCLLACGGAGRDLINGTSTDQERVDGEPMQAANPGSQPDEVRRLWVQKVAKLRASRVEQLTSDAEEAEERYEKGVKDGVGASTRQALKKEAAGRRAAIDAVSRWEPRDMPETLSVGDVAKLGSDQGALILTVIQVIDEGNALMKGGDELYWLVTPTTRGLYAGSRMSMDAVVEYTGTQSYRTRAGTTRTVPVLAYHPELQ
jgi:hypothetical protein